MFGVYLGGINVSARRNRFEDAGGGTIASSVGMDFYGFPGEPSGTYVMEDNVFWNNGRAPSSPIVQIAGAYPSTSILRRNTFYRAPLWVSANDNLIERNIIYRSGEHSFVCCGHTRVVCNDQYPDTVRVGGHAPSFADNISADPLFCGPDTGDLTISMYSPCAPEHAPAGCGGIGALGTSCGVTPIETTTWGRLKLRFSK